MENKKPTYEELERLNRKLEDELNLYKTIIENVPISVFAKDAQNEYRYIIWNKELERVFGIKTESIIGIHDYQLFENKEEADYFRNYDISVMNGHEIVDIPAEDLRTAEGMKIVHTRKIPIYDENNNPRILLGCLEDISIKKKLEQELIEIKERYEYATMIGHVGTWDWDLITNKLIWNTETFKILGLNPANTIPSYDLFLDKLHPADKINLDESVKAAWYEKKPYSVDCRILLDDGRTRYCNATGKVDYDNQNNPIRMAGTFQDITARKEMEEKLKEREKDLLAINQEYQAINEEYLTINEELQQTIEQLSFAKKSIEESEEKFKSIVKSSPSAMYFYKLDEKNNLILIGANPAADQTIGIPHGSLIGKTIEEAFPNLINTEIPELYRKVASGQTPHHSFEIEYTDIRFSGYYSVHVYKTQPCTIAVEFNDISMRRKAELALIESEKLSKELNAAKDKFFSIISHDLKSPFNSLLGFTALLLDDLEEYDKQKIRQQLTYIKDIAGRTYNLLEDLLLWSKSQIGTIAFVPYNNNLKELCDEVFDILVTQADKKQIKITCEFAEDTTVFADSFMLKTVLRNLVANAIKFTNTSGLIQIFAQHVDNNKIITVSDNGTGIQASVLEKLWDFSQQHSSPGTAGEKGTGLGLILCKDLIERHGGKIWVESEPGKGSDFKFSLPDKNS